MSLVEIKQAAIDYALQEFACVAREKNIPGIAFGLILNGELIFTSGVGETKIGNAITPTADSIFRIASLSKSFTADAILLLRNRGLLRLEDPISKLLPWCSTMVFNHGCSRSNCRANDKRRIDNGWWVPDR